VRRREHLKRRSETVPGLTVTTPIVKSQPETKPSGILWHHKRDEEVKDAGRRPLRYKRELERRAAPGTVPDVPNLDLDDATFVAHGNQTAVYQLKSKPHIGVLVVPTMSVPVSHEVRAIQHMLTLLAERNVTHLILDFSNNGGGFVSFASELANIFFPTQDKTINSH
ncbi:hypothetical protein BGZ93_004669, partial [Podila epicladia]